MDTVIRCFRQERGTAHSAEPLFGYTSTRVVWKWLLGINWRHPPARRSTGAGARARKDGYVELVLVPTLRPGDIVIMANLAAHKDERIVALIVAAGAEVHFLPPYSPDLNHRKNVE